MNRSIQINSINPNKLRIIYMSDLHLEGDYDYLLNNNLTRYTPENTKADIIVLAGDIHNGTKAKNYIDFLISKGFIVIYVLGNHEFWFHDYDTLIESWREIDSQTENLYFLEKDIITINSVDFIGCCLWSALGSKDSAEPVDFFIKSALSDCADFDNIKGMSCTTMQAHFFDSFNFIKESINHERKQIVVTHYAPSELSSPHHYRGKLTNEMFYTELGNFISYNNIIAWIHGHMHNTSYYHIHNTLIACNPSGYFNYQVHNNDFDSNKSIVIKTD